MRLGIDIDGVLADFNASFVKLVPEVTGRSLFPPYPFDITTWQYPQSYGYTADEESMVWRRVCSNPTFWQSLPAYEDAVESLRLLAARAHDGDDIYYVTSRPGVVAKRQTEKWLRQNGLADRPTVLISGKKGMCAEALDLQFYIDDRDVNVRDVAETRGEKTKTFLLDRPWNHTDVAEHEQVIRVKSVKEIGRAHV